MRHPSSSDSRRSPDACCSRAGPRASPSPGRSTMADRGRRPPRCTPRSERARSVGSCVRSPSRTLRMRSFRRRCATRTSGVRPAASTVSCSWPRADPAAWCSLRADAVAVEAWWVSTSLCASAADFVRASASGLSGLSERVIGSAQLQRHRTLDSAHRDRRPRRIAGQHLERRTAGGIRHQQHGVLHLHTRRARVERERLPELDRLIDARARAADRDRCSRPRHPGDAAPTRRRRSRARDTPR